jgi:PIN domain nuclease of toxin-antitoxin system
VRLLLDTHGYLWAVGDTKRLGSRTRSMIEDRANDVFVSIVSLWEIVLKADKLKADIPKLLQSIVPSGFVLLPLAISHLQKQVEMGERSADPFDRLLIAQAAHEGLALITADAAILASPPIEAIECGTGRRYRAVH